MFVLWAAISREKTAILIVVVAGRRGRGEALLKQAYPKISRD